jgi:polar amino acid transport system permease protein
MPDAAGAGAPTFQARSVAMGKRIRFTPLDWFLAGLVGASAGYVFHRVAVDLDYRWNWPAIPQYLLRYDAAQGRWVVNYLLEGFLTTIRLSVWGTLLATLFGTVMGLARTGPRLFYRLLGGAYVGLVRNTPPLVLIFLFYFFVSDQLMPALGITYLAEEAPPRIQAFLAVIAAPPSMLPAFLSALITLSLFEGAYITEIVRSGIQSIETGQWEASAALGFSRRQQLRHVILPQAVRRILPPLAGQFISTIKDSAIVSVISVQELTFQGLDLMAATYLTFEIWITVALLYLLLTLSCSLVLRRLEVLYRRP